MYTWCENQHVQKIMNYSVDQNIKKEKTETICLVFYTGVQWSSTTESLKNCMCMEHILVDSNFVSTHFGLASLSPFFSIIKN